MRPFSRRALLAASLMAPLPREWTAAATGAFTSGDDAVATYRGNLARTGLNFGPGPLEAAPVRWWIRLGELITSSPPVVDGVIYIGSISPSTIEGGALHAVDADTGIERWRLPTVHGDGIFGSPAVGEGIVVVGSYDGIVIAANITTGEERWRFERGFAFHLQSLALVREATVGTDTERRRFDLVGANGSR